MYIPHLEYINIHIFFSFFLHYFLLILPSTRLTLFLVCLLLRKTLSFFFFKAPLLSCPLLSTSIYLGRNPQWQGHRVMQPGWDSLPFHPWRFLSLRIDHDPPGSSKARYCDWCNHCTHDGCSNWTYLPLYPNCAVK